ncbi:MAG: hypothetical protein OXH99_04970 [Bryobacterales bacterium]|nr:hypothetical protein [Bryobacterales bacterium]
MSVSQDVATSGLSLGVLVIGSLRWDPERDEWRNARLDLDDSYRVQVPICYGRLASTRQSYTMVFAPDQPERRFGQAIAIRCKSHGLVEEAKCLWAAESNSSGDQGVSAGWGCVGLLPNPNSKRLLSGELRRWRDFVSECGSRRSNYRTLAAANAGVDEEGFLKIGWPKPVAGSSLPFDALLGTATKPTRIHSGFLSPQDIAAEWKTTHGKHEVRYFWNNRKHGICTYQDKEIENYLLRPDR